MSNLPKYRRINKYNIDMRALMKNDLRIVYDNNNTVRKFPKQKITTTMRDLVYRLVEHDMFDKTEYDKLNKKEQILFYKLCNACHKNVGLTDPDDFLDAYNILVGEIEAGNASSKQALRNLISDAILTHTISAKEGIVALNAIQ